MMVEWEGNERGMRGKWEGNDEWGEGRWVDWRERRVNNKSHTRVKLKIKVTEENKAIIAQHYSMKPTLLRFLEFSDIIGNDGFAAGSEEVKEM